MTRQKWWIVQLIHSTSVSYYPENVFMANQAIEEGSVDFLTYLICQEKGIHTAIGYHTQVQILDALFENQALNLGNKIEFAHKLVSVPLPQRYDWLEKQVSTAMIDASASIADMDEVIQLLRLLEGPIHEQHAGTVKRHS